MLAARVLSANSWAASSPVPLPDAWSRVSLLGEGGRLETEVSDMLHKQVTVFASWVTSLQWEALG